MENALSLSAKTVLVEATVAEDGSLHPDGPTPNFKPGDKVLLTISPIAEPTGENPKLLLGIVIRYDDPFGPATSEEEWEAVRGC